MNRRGPIIPGAPLVTVPARNVASFVPAFVPAEPSPTASAAPVVPKTAAGVTDRGEFSVSSIAFPANGVEFSVWKSQEAWTGCDVYLQLDTPIDGTLGLTTFRVCVYAIANGSRTLVRSGFARVPDGILTTLLDNGWIAAARNACLRWEVTLTMFSSNVPYPTGGMTVTCAAANDLPEPPSHVGVVPAGIVSIGPDLDVASFFGLNELPFLEVVRVQGVNNTTSTPLWLHLHDLPTSVSLTGIIPLMVWPLGVGKGQGIDKALGLRLIRNLRLVLSSQPNHTVPPPAGSGYVQALMR